MTAYLNQILFSVALNYAADKKIPTIKPRNVLPYPNPPPKVRYVN